MPGLAENSIFVSSCLFWCLFSMCISYRWGLRHLSYCLCPRNENGVVLIHPNEESSYVSLFVFLQIAGGCVGRGLDLFGKGREMRRWSGKNGCFLSWMSATVLLSCFWELTCCQALPVQLSVRCSGGQPVPAASKSAGGILSSGAQFVEIQGRKSYAEIFKS